jgi:hypothetical protein
MEDVMAAKKSTKAATRKIEKAAKNAKKKMSKAKRDLTLTVGQAKAATLKALRAAHRKEKVLTAPFVEKFQSAWKREVKRVKKATK